jgi:ferrous-iron efflux pump FieF
MTDEAANSAANKSHQTLSTAQRTLLIKSASYASLCVALSLVLLKTWGWQETASVSLLSSLADSILDVFASAITFWAVRYSLSPADADHRFGHGKSEGLAALVQAFIIAGSGLYVCYEAISRIFSPREIAAPEIGLGVIIIATAATVMLVWFQRYVGRKTGSVAIKADAMHYQTDLMINLGVGLAIILTSWTGFTIIDPLVGMIIAIIVLNSVFGIMNHSLEILLDHEIPLEDRQSIEAIALAHPDVRGFHDMRTRYGGSNYIVQFHLELEADITLRRTHDILDDVEALVMQRYPECEILIHADPLGLHEERDGFDQS